MRTVLLLLFLSTGFMCPSQGLLVTNGAHLRTKDGIVLVVQNASIVNNGAAEFSQSEVVFRGNANSTIGGTGANQLKKLVMSKDAGQLNLQSALTVSEQVNFVGGNINLNNQTLTLSPQALIVGEWETRRFIGSTGGEIVIVADLNAPSFVNAGNLGVTITSTANLGPTIIKRGHKLLTPSTVQRYYEVIPANNIPLNANVAFQYFDAELNGLNENFLTILRKTNNNFQDIGNDAFNTTFNFVGKTNLDQMGTFAFASAIGAPLPVKFILFNSICQANGILLNWKTGEELNTKEFVVELSTDATHWTPTFTVNAAGSTRSERTYSQLVSSGSDFYRIVAVDFDGKKTYSSVIKTSCSSGSNMQLWPNPVSSLATISLEAERNTAAVVRIVDAKGSIIKTVEKSLLPGVNQFTIDMSGLTPGYYSVVVQCENKQESFPVIKK